MTGLNHEQYRQKLEELGPKEIHVSDRNSEQEQLENLLCQPMVDAHYNKLEKVVSELMSKYIIVQNDDIYEIIEAEVYYYNKHHRDITTYERDMKGGRFFFHQSGVDITFSSSCKKTGEKIDAETSYFGGILIRSLKRNKPDGSVEYILGPLKCVETLWADFNAIEPSESEYPRLKYKPIDNVKIERDKRHFPIKKGKEKSKLKALKAKFNNMDDFSLEDLNHFLQLKYRFVRVDIIPDKQVLAKYSNRTPSPCPEIWNQAKNTQNNLK